MPRVNAALKILRARLPNLKEGPLQPIDVQGLITLLEYDNKEEHGYKAGVKAAVFQFESYARPRYMRGEINSFDMVQDVIDAFITDSCFECTRCCQMVLGAPGYVSPPLPSSSDGLPDVICQRCAEEEQRAWEVHDRMYPDPEAARHFEPDPRD